MISSLCILHSFPLVFIDIFCISTWALFLFWQECRYRWGPQACLFLIMDLTCIKNDGTTFYSSHVRIVAHCLNAINGAASHFTIKYLQICKELVEKWACSLPDWHLCQPSGVPPAEHSGCKSQTDTSLPEWSYQVLSLHMRSCFPVWSHWNLPFSLKLFLLPSLFRVEGLMEWKRLHCAVVRDHLNYKFNLCFTVTSHHSSPCF